MTKKTRQRKNLKRRSRKQSRRRRVMRQRGGVKSRTNSHFLNIDNDFTEIGNGEYGVVLVDKNGVESSRKYLDKETFEALSRQELGRDEIKFFDGGSLRYIEENGIRYLHYDYK